MVKQTIYNFIIEPFFFISFSQKMEVKFILQSEIEFVVAYFVLILFALEHQLYTKRQFLNQTTNSHGQESDYLKICWLKIVFSVLPFFHKMDAHLAFTLDRFCT